MIRPVILYGDPILELESTEVDRGNKMDIKLLINDMFDTMHRAFGVGLSAVQIGIPLKLFVIEAHIKDPQFDFIGVFINPVILRELGPLVKHPEGCLSVPNITAFVERNESVELEWYDQDWIYHKEVFSGFAARIIQHEYDHLQGDIFINKIDKMWKEMLENSLELIINREMEVPYPWK
jgi:peptide deformylase